MLSVKRSETATLPVVFPHVHANDRVRSSSRRWKSHVHVVLPDPFEHDDPIRWMGRRRRQLEDDTEEHYIARLENLPLDEFDDCESEAAGPEPSDFERDVNVICKMLEIQLSVGNKLNRPLTLDDMESFILTGRVSLKGGDVRQQVVRFASEMKAFMLAERSNNGLDKREVVSCLLPEQRISIMQAIDLAFTRKFAAHPLFEAAFRMFFNSHRNGNRSVVPRVAFNDTLMPPDLRKKLNRLHSDIRFAVRLQLPL